MVSSLFRVSQFCGRRQSSQVLFRTYVTKDKAEAPLDPIVQIENARLRYPSNDLAKHPATTTAITIDELKIWPPSKGGHALIGANASGKSLVAQAIASSGSKDFVQQGTFQTFGPWYSSSVAKVSFASHQQLLQLSAESPEGLTASKAISDGGNLSKAAQFLVVRFGLFHLLQRDVTTLSTGEIRKCLLVRALANRPRLIVLDNAFDGLDVASREILKDIVSKTLLGFKQDMLVQAVSSKHTARTQVLLITHRAEEIVDEVENISYFSAAGTGGLVNERRRRRTGIQLLSASLEEQDSHDHKSESSMTQLAWNKPTLPSTDTLHEWWGSLAHRDGSNPIVVANNLSIERGSYTLLKELSWKVEWGERWLVAGGNGAGKSTLSRLLVQPDPDVPKSALSIETNPNQDGPAMDSQKDIAWVSTEAHMNITESEELVSAILSKHATHESYQLISSWLEFPCEELLDQPFRELSQGQQKMILIMAAIASKPKLLILDEPVQGLDLRNRRAVLELVNRVCEATDMSLIYITHHLEELIPSISHVLHLKDRSAAYNGTVKQYDPTNL